VRHWKDGPVENSRSKAHLLAAVHQVLDDHKHQSYFPAYEIVMDDLRWVSPAHASSPVFFVNLPSGLGLSMHLD
jgi:hypothetical protein